MNITRKSLLLASAAAAVIGLGFSASPAKAFDEVNWTWEKLVTEDVLKTVNVLIDAAPTGMVELEKIQFMIGDVTASSSVTNFTNNPPGTEEPAGGPTPAPEPGPQLITIDLKALYEDEKKHQNGENQELSSLGGGGWFEFAKGGPIDGLELKDGTTEGVELSGDFEGYVDEKKDKVWLTFDVLVPPTEVDGGEGGPTPGPQPILIGERLAIDLPAVNSQATAVGNNQDIASSSSIQLHDAQYIFGDITGETSDLFNPEGNSHVNALDGLVTAAGLGLIETANVSADSSVSTILNATVNSEATAVANNMSVDLAAFTPDDAFMIGDVTQFAYADVTATSFVDDVTLEGYSDMGAAGLGPNGLSEDMPQIPAVNSVATAVGNNFSVNVSSPDL